MIKRLALTGLLLIANWQLLAKDSSSGCGPGWYVAKDNSLLSSLGRQITHGILSPIVTLGMTLGTSNCSKHSIVRLEKQQEHYIASNFDQLKTALARGNGSYLDSFLPLTNCPKDSHPILTHELRQGFGKIYQNNPEPRRVWQRMSQIITKHDKLKNVCS